MFKYLENTVMNRPEQLITYAEFMTIALYEPTYGYYMTDRQKIGKTGDFITTSNIHNIYGKVVAKWYAALVNKLQLQPRVCELGAGNGRFAQAFIEEWEKHSHQRLEYVIVETSPYHRKLQQKILPMETTVRVVTTIEQLAPFSGLVFSNELFDALPVHVIEKKDGELFEVMIGIESGELVEKNIPLEDRRIFSFLEKYEFELSEGQRIEIPLEMSQLVRQITDTVELGLVITVDYGYTKSEWMEPARKRGSLRGYYQHQLLEDVLQYVGKMDITSHVHFDALVQEGEERGLQFVTKQRQDEFLLAIGILDELQNHVDPNPFSEASKRNRAIRNLIMPSGMSGYFHVITQQKGTLFTQEDLFRPF